MKATVLAGPAPLLLCLNCTYVSLSRAWGCKRRAEAEGEMQRFERGHVGKQPHARCIARCAQCSPGAISDLGDCVVTIDP